MTEINEAMDLMDFDRKTLASLGEMLIRMSKRHRRQESFDVHLPDKGASQISSAHRASSPKSPSKVYPPYLQHLLQHPSSDKLVSERKKLLESIRAHRHTINNETESSLTYSMQRMTRTGSAELSEMHKLRMELAHASSQTTTGDKRKSCFVLVQGDADNINYQPKPSGMIQRLRHSTNIVRLLWERQPSRVLIIKKPNVEETSIALRTMSDWLHKEWGIISVVEPAVMKELQLNEEYLATWQSAKELEILHETIDFIICLGGDGTILWVNSLFPQAVPPVISFAQGSLGFMTPFPVSTFESSLASVIKGKFYMTMRDRLTCEVFRFEPPLDWKPPHKDRPEYSDDEDTTFHAAGRLEVAYQVLNEISIDRGGSSALTDLACYCDEEFVTNVRADGLLLGTPTGSTAYSLSAGGSMVHPNVDAILFTPVCPHSLSFRPILFPGGSRLIVQVNPGSRSTSIVSFDGRQSIELQRNDFVVVSSSKYPVPAVCKNGETSDWLDSVRVGLHWNSRG